MENIKDLHTLGKVKDTFGINWSPYVLLSDINYLKISLNYVSLDLFNQVCEDLVARRKKQFYAIFAMTRSGGISQKQPLFKANYYKLRKSKTKVELIIMDIRGITRIMYSGQLSNNDVTNAVNKEKVLSGRKALKILITELSKDSIDLYDYKVEREDGERIHNEDKIINKRMIKIVDETLIDKTIDNVHHLDLNSAFAAGIAANYPEMSTTLTRLYNMRHEEPDYKQVLTNSIGAMESDINGYKWAHITCKSHEWVNNQMEMMLKLIYKKGGKPLLLNIDGIWYYSEQPLSINQVELGGWKNDHTNCQFRFKSSGSYEFIEDGVYRPVQRGLTKFDIIKPNRLEWQWGDIYQKDAMLIETVSYYDLGEYGPDKEFMGLVRILEDEHTVAERYKR